MNSAMDGVNDDTNNGAKTSDGSNSSSKAAVQAPKKGEGTIVPPDASRLTQAFRLIRGLLRHHKRLFFTAVGCAA
ncbi:MAG: hypothetical protein JJD93_10955, partial [Ilumatobacteraceae bacterium]|nr:hypothetical protein [Ilumatobacteraceae bacterium]